jgi:RNA polymerase sigma-70 factor (ECF subfamily)
VTKDVTAVPKLAREGEERLYYYRDALRSFFRRRLASPDEVEDLVQEAYARLLASARRRDVEYPLAYLFRIASNLLADHRHRQALSRQWVEIGDTPEELAVSPDQEHARHLADLQNRLSASLSLLPDRCREVFLMRRFRGMTTPEIADALGISDRMVQKHLARAMTHVFMSLNDCEGSHP